MDSGTYVPLGRDGTGEATVIDTTPLIRLALQRQNSADRYKAAQAKAQGDADKQLLDQAKTLTQGNHGVMAQLSNPYEENIVSGVQKGIASGKIRPQDIAVAKLEAGKIQSEDDAINQAYKELFTSFATIGGNTKELEDNFLRLQLAHQRNGGSRKDFPAQEMLNKAFDASITEPLAISSFLSNNGQDEAKLVAYNFPSKNVAVGRNGAVQEASISLLKPVLQYDKDGKPVNYMRRSNGRPRYDITAQQVLDDEKTRPAFAKKIIDTNYEASKKELAAEFPNYTPTELDIKRNAYELAMHREALKLGANTVKQANRDNPNPPKSGATAAQKNAAITLVPMSANKNAAIQGSSVNRIAYPGGSAFVLKVANGTTPSVASISAKVYAQQGATSVERNTTDANKFTIGPIRYMLVGDPTTVGPNGEGVIKPNPDGSVIDAARKQYQAVAKEIEDGVIIANRGKSTNDKITVDDYLASKEGAALAKKRKEAEAGLRLAKSSKGTSYAEGEPIFPRLKGTYGSINPATGLPYGTRLAPVVGLSPSINDIQTFESSSEGTSGDQELNVKNQSERLRKRYETVYAPLDQLPEVGALITPEQQQKLDAEGRRQMSPDGLKNLLSSYNIAPTKPKPAARTAAPAPTQPQAAPPKLSAKAQAASDKLKNYKP